MKEIDTLGSVAKLSLAVGAQLANDLTVYRVFYLSRSGETAETGSAHAESGSLKLGSGRPAICTFGKDEGLKAQINKHQIFG